MIENIDIQTPNCDPLVLALRAGIDRWLKQNLCWQTALLEIPACEIYRMEVDQQIFDEMDATTWIAAHINPTGDVKAETMRHVIAWDAAFDLITQALCPSVEEYCNGDS